MAGLYFHVNRQIYIVFGETVGWNFNEKFGTPLENTVLRVVLSFCKQTEIVFELFFKTTNESKTDGFLYNYVIL